MWKFLLGALVGWYFGTKDWMHEVERTIEYEPDGPFVSDESEETE